MIKKKSLYYCTHCGNIVESVWDGKPSLSCCGEEMQELRGNVKEAATEKHIPVVERSDNGIRVKVGETAHPMTEEHYILFIEVLAGDQVYRHDLKSGDAAQADFPVRTDGPLTVRAFCNIHGLWQTTA